MDMKDTNTRKLRSTGKFFSTIVLFCTSFPLRVLSSAVGCTNEIPYANIKDFQRLIIGSGTIDKFGENGVLSQIYFSNAVRKFLIFIIINTRTIIDEKLIFVGLTSSFPSIYVRYPSFYECSCRFF